MSDWRSVDTAIVGWDQPEPEIWERKLKLNERGTFPSAKALARKRKGKRRKAKT